MGTVDLNLLSVLVAVGRTSSFSAAAKELGLPKSSVSRAIAKLEAAMNVRLVQRTTRRVALSTAGAALYEKVTPLLATLEMSVCAVPELREEPSGMLRVAASVDFGSTVLAEIVSRFVARYPTVQVDVRLSNAKVDLVADGFDVAMRFLARRPKDSSLSGRQVSPLAAQLFAAPTYLARRGTPRTPADLEGHEWVVFRDGEAISLGGPDTSVTVTPRGRIHADDMFFIREAVRNGAGIGLLPTFIAEPDVSAGALVRLLPRWSTRIASVWILTPHARQLPPKVTAFRDLVIETLASRPLAPAI